MEGNVLAPTTPTEQPKKRRGPLSITERLASVREAGKAKLAKLEAKRDAKAAEVRALAEQIDALRAEIGIHEDDEPAPMGFYAQGTSPAVDARVNELIARVASHQDADLGPDQPAYSGEDGPD